ncbi:MAG TPA: glutathione S-transferase family protein [Hellea balneolensis]|uniref:Glutathione S-transferase family protein n=1 Tax=Hellea balneolensis TaxID=287478 RepID=A0A7C5R0C4_9PROT|nr:glutathione S-transferase family protein [Hellea balneolensis]
MIEFYKFPSKFGMRDASPFVLKLETYLRLAGLDYKTTELADPRKAPKGKLPFIKDGERTIADSSLVILYLKDKYGDPLGAPFTPAQHGIGHGIKTMLEEHTYWALVYSRWIEEDAQKLVRDAWFGTIPAPIRGLIFGKIIRDMKKGMFAHGIGRHTREEIYAFGVADVKAFENVLGDKPFLLGDQPSEYDATGYGFLSNMTAEVFASPMRDYIESSPSLLAYIDRVGQKAFG